jgi:hypothetical protein
MLFEGVIRNLMHGEEGFHKFHWIGVFGQIVLHLEVLLWSQVEPDLLSLHYIAISIQHGEAIEIQHWNIAPTGKDRPIKLNLRETAMALSSGTVGALAVHSEFWGSRTGVALGLRASQ